jgi:hypothetical protein
MKLAELHEIAKSAKTIKFNGVKKETLIGQFWNIKIVLLDSTSEQWKLKLRMISPKASYCACKKGCHSKHKQFFVLK